VPGIQRADQLDDEDAGRQARRRAPDLEQEGRAITRLAAGSTGARRAPRGRRQLRRGEAQRVSAACSDGQRGGKRRSTLRLAANGQAVAATSRHLGHGRQVPRCRGASLRGSLRGQPVAAGA
jgi:hypothetical protein